MRATHVVITRIALRGPVKFFAVFCQAVFHVDVEAEERAGIEHVRGNNQNFSRACYTERFTAMLSSNIQVTM
jgi:hypothetical protein